MICKKCGKEMPESTSFCEYCGERLHQGETMLEYCHRKLNWRRAKKTTARRKVVGT